MTIRTCAVVCLCLSASVLRAQEAEVAGENDASDDRYKWELEGTEKGEKPAAEGQEGAVQAGISPEAYDKMVGDNIRLRKDNAELHKSLEAAGKINVDLVEKVRALESAASKSGESAPKVEETAGTGEAGVALATTLEENLALQEQNRTLQTDVEKLRDKVSRLEGQASTGAGSGVSEGSDLFKRLQQENASLSLELQTLKQAVKLTGEDGKKATAATAEALRKVKQLEADNALLKKDNGQMKEAVLVLDSKAREAGDAKAKLATAQKELEQKDKLLSEAGREIEKLAGIHDRLTKAEKERTDLLFNLGALYTRAGMYREAVTAFKKVLETEAGAFDAHYNLGVIYDKHLPDRKKAAYHLRKFLKLDPLNGDADKVKRWLADLETGG